MKVLMTKIIVKLEIAAIIHAYTEVPYKEYLI